MLRLPAVRDQPGAEDGHALAARVALLEAKLNEAQGQQAALESMYQDLARGRDERLLEARDFAQAMPQYQAQGWPIGSGVVESANKLVVEARLNGALQLSRGLSRVAAAGEGRKAA